MGTPTQVNGGREVSARPVPPPRPRRRKDQASLEQTARALSQMGSWSYRWKSAVRSWVTRLLG